MDEPYRLTPHAKRRMSSRNAPVECVLAALYDGRRTKHPSGREMRYDRESRWTVIVNPRERVIVTVFRMTKRQAKRPRHTIRS